MTAQEVKEFRIALLDMVHEQAAEPVPDIEAVRRLVDDFVARLECEGRPE